MKKKSSRWYWLLPIIFNWLGGLTGWLILKDEDRQKANNILLLGLVIMGLEILSIFVILFALLYE